MLLDTYREVVTPEGVALHLPAAGPVPRALAWAIDFAIRFAALAVAGMAFGALGRGGMGFYAVTMFLLYWFYPVLFEALWKGRTPGKRALGLRVVAANGAPVGWLAAFVRNLLRAVDMLPLAYATGLTASLLDPWGRRLGDLVAGTLVVHEPRDQPPPAPAVPGALAPPLALRPHEQAALLAFAERGPRLTPARQEELADLAEPLTGMRGAPGVTRLYAIANWLLGRR